MLKWILIAAALLLIDYAWIAHRGGEIGGHCFFAFIFLIAKWRITRRQAVVRALARRLDATADFNVPVDFLGMFDAPPWAAWDSRHLKINHLIRGRKPTPEYWIIDMVYTSPDDDVPLISLTFIVVALTAIPQAQVWPALVPEGLTVNVSDNFLYLYDTRTWMGVVNFMLLSEVAEALRHALAMARKTPAGRADPVWASKPEGVMLKV